MSSLELTALPQDNLEMALFSQRQLEPNERVEIDIDANPLMDRDEVQLRQGMNAKLIAEILAGGAKFLLFDTRNTTSNRDFIIERDKDQSLKPEFKGVLKDEPLIIGRAHLADRFTYPDTVSREHFRVEYTDEGLFVQNLNPTNETILTANVVGERQNKKRRFVEELKTVGAVIRVLDMPGYGSPDEKAPNGYFLNHPIIGRNSQSVDGGVYLGGSSREAILVDGKSDDILSAQRELRAEIARRYPQGVTAPVEGLLMLVKDKVQALMPYDAAKTSRISRKYYGDQLIGLSTYVREKAGVCRHQALLAAYLIEGLLQAGQIAGTIGVERNTVPDMGGSHAWALFTPEGAGREDCIVIDPAQSFIGTKARALHEQRWEYRLAVDEILSQD